MSPGFAASAVFFLPGLGIIYWMHNPYHPGELKDAFAARIEVEKTARGSTIRVSYTRPML